MSKSRNPAATATLTAAVLGGVALSVTLVGVQVATAQPPDSAKVCPPLNSNKIDTTGDPMTVTIPNEEAKLPAGMVIVEYCVKAGSANQGLGPKFVTVDPGEESVTFKYPAADKAISHYSFAWAAAPTPSPSPTVSPSPTPTPAPDPETTVTPASPETPLPVDSDELAPDETFPVDIANPGAVAIDEESAPVRPASPPQEASVPTSVPAGGGAASKQHE